MRCEELQRHLADHLSGTLPAGTADAVASHLQSCGRCAAEAAALADTWQALADLLIVPADTGGMRARFAMMLEQHHEQARARPSSTSSSSRWQWSAPAAAWAGAAAAILLLGVALGQQTAAAPPIDPQMAALREELRDMRELMTLTLLQQQSASDRLTGVAWTRQLDHPGDTIAAALVEVLTRDPNVNVRIAAVDALGRLADSDTVRRGAIEALPQEPSPLVQVALIDLLVQVNGREAADALRRLSSDPVVDSAVRARAAQGLAQVGT
jgi:anti-sigma factor RsiW